MSTTVGSDTGVRFKAVLDEVGHMRIGELARATGVSPRSLRYYEQQGLLRSQRAAGSLGRPGHRRYDEDAVATVTHIRALLATGLPTSLIYELLPCVEGPGPQLEQCATPLLRDHLARVDEQMAALAVARGRLRELLARHDDEPARRPRRPAPERLDAAGAVPEAGGWPP
jgi:DNA-binding transcriptional MerR regulator